MDIQDTKLTGLVPTDQEAPLNVSELSSLGSRSDHWPTRTSLYLQVIKLVEEAITPIYPNIDINEALFHHSDTLSLESSLLEIALQEDIVLSKYKRCLSDVFKTFSGIGSGHMSHIPEDLENHNYAIQVAERLAHIGIIVGRLSFKETIFEDMIKLANKLEDVQQKESLARISLVFAGKISKYPENMEKFKSDPEVQTLSEAYKRDQMSRISNSTIQFLNIINVALDGKVEELAKEVRASNSNTLMPPNSYLKFEN